MKPGLGRLREVVAALQGRRILVIADLVADEFVIGRAERVSREAPVLILSHESDEVRLGGGANAIHNIRAMGGRPVPIGVLGRDAYGRRLRALLKERGIPAAEVRSVPGYATPVKSRVQGGGIHQARQQIVRIDRVKPLAATAARGATRAALGALRGFDGRVDGVLVSDYGLGFVGPELVREAIAFAKRRQVPIAVDSRHGLLAQRGMTAITPNESEAEEALGTTIGNDRRRLEAAGRKLLRRVGARAVLITRGSDGMALFEPGRKTLHIPIFGTDEVADVTGAGDTVIAAFTLALAAGATATEAAILANYAGGVVVMKHGTATVSANELLAAAAADAPEGV